MSELDLTDAERERLERAFARVAYARLLGISLAASGRGRATLEMDVRPELMQSVGEGVLHGGALASLIDTASAFAVLSLLAEGETTATVDLTVHYLLPVSRGRLSAQARVLRAGRRLVSVAVEVRDRAGELTATALTTYARRSGQAPPPPDALLPAPENPPDARL